MCLVLTSSNTSSSAFYLNMCQRSANSAEWMRNESICNSAAFLRQKRDYLNIQGGICKEPSGKEFCQHFCAPVSLVHSLPHSLLLTLRHTGTMLGLGSSGKRPHASQTSLTISWQSNCGKLFMPFEFVCSHWPSALCTPPPPLLPTCKMNVHAYYISLNKAERGKTYLHPF